MGICNLKVLGLVFVLFWCGGILIHQVEGSSQTTLAEKRPKEGEKETKQFFQKETKQQQQLEKRRRPNLLHSQTQVRKTVFQETDFEYLQTTLEFDEDVYLNEPMLCGGADHHCLLNQESDNDDDCLPCDWSKQLPQGCENSAAHCCGFSNPLSEQEIAQQNEWCNPNSSISWTTVSFNQKTETFFLAPNEIKFFRFFIDNEDYCRIIQITVDADYGTSVLTASNKFAFPNRSIVSPSVLSLSPFFSYSQSALTICPTTNLFYNKGTYAFSVDALEPTSFTVEVVLSSQKLPLPLPKERVSCEEVPEEEFVVGRGEDEERIVLCLEDGKTLEYEFPKSYETKFAELILPVPPGCHTISLAVSSFTISSTDLDLFCFPTLPDEPVSFSNSARSRWKFNDDSLLFTGCFDSLTYVHCASQIYLSGVVKMIWSTMAEPWRRLLSSIQPGALSMRSGLGVAAGVIEGSTFVPCGDWRTRCFYWITQPTSDPLIFWPPIGDIGRMVLGPFENHAPDLFLDRRLSLLSNRTVVAVTFTKKGDTTFHSTDLFLSQGSLALFSMTNKEGIPLSLSSSNQHSPNPRSFRNYIPNIEYKNVDVISRNLGEECEIGQFQLYWNLTQEKVAKAIESETVSQFWGYHYSINVFGTSIARTSCWENSIQYLIAEEGERVFREQRSCRFDEESQMEEWESDPCCNLRLLPRDCCSPYNLTANATYYKKGNKTQFEDCRNPECSMTFASDLAKSINSLGDPLLGCSLEIPDPEYELQVRTEKEIDQTVRACLQKVGFGENFEGIDCNRNEDCLNISNSCNLQTGKCHLLPLAEVEESHLRCFISHISPALEHYLRSFVLPPSAENLLLNSEEFFSILLESASVPDCVNENTPLDLSRRTKSLYYSEYSCREGWNRYFNLSQDISDENCVAQSCLGNHSCRFLDDRCFNWICAVTKLIPSSESSCSVISTEDQEETNGRCEYCPFQEDQTPNSNCVTISSIISSSQCAATTVCELPDGTLLTNVTEEECHNFSSCSVNCWEESCRAFDERQGVCEVVVSDENECSENWDGFWFSEEICLLVKITNSLGCSQLDGQWHTCSSLDLGSCNPNSLSLPQQYLQCIPDILSECKTEESCLASGRCSDIEYTRIIHSSPSNMIEIQYGACFNSGYYSAIAPLLLPRCRSNYSRIGCFDPSKGNSSCLSFDEVDKSVPDEWVWNAWVAPAKTEEECLEKVAGRLGCLVPGSSYRLWMWDEEDCACRGGVSQMAWSWEPGVWSYGKTHKLQWTTQKQSPYTWRPSLSFFLLESWVMKSVEQLFLYPLKSHLVCESNVVANPLSWITCDCVNLPDDQQEAPCEETSPSLESPVGLGLVCADLQTTIKGPSSSFTFYNNTISEGCFEVFLASLSHSWFLHSKRSSQLSFQFDVATEEQGGVTNSKGATIGELVGDGSVIECQFPNLITQKMKICLFVELKHTFPIPDFGFSTSDYLFVSPLGVSVEMEKVNELQFLCGELSLDQLKLEGNRTIIFPIFRAENYEKEEDRNYSETTYILVTILGAFYCADLVLVFISFVFEVRHFHKKKGPKRKMIPLTIWAAVCFLVLCSFRIAYCFLFREDVFEGESLFEYLFFITPTFTLFSLLIIAIWYWQRAVKSPATLGHSSVTSLLRLFFALVLLWLLFLLMAVLYSEYVLEVSTETSCNGRVQNDDERESRARTLSIAYQSIIVVLSFLLGALFGYWSYQLYLHTDQGMRYFRFVFFPSLILLVSQILRSIFFLIILIADFSSSIYMFIVLFITEVLMVFCFQSYFSIWRLFLIRNQADSSIESKASIE